MTHSVCILPAFKPGDIGGVARHVLALRKHLPAFGWEVTGAQGAADLMHTHALDTWPEIDCYTNHGTYPIKPEMPQWQREANERLLDNIKLARRVIAVSRWTAGQWDYLTGVRPIIIPNGIDPEEWQDVPRGRWRARLRIPEHRPLVVWGKTFLSDVLDPTAAVEVALRRPDVDVVAPLDRKFLPHAPKNFHCIGAQQFAAMQMLLADCDVYLATVCENHSIQVLEAMALRKPVVGFAWGGTAETIGDSGAGLLVEPGNLDRLMDAFEVALEVAPTMGEAGRELVLRHYDWRSVAESLAGVYSDVLQEKTVSGRSQRPKASIIIPCYNKAQYIGEAILSAAGQRNAPKYEVIVVDDGSTDGSLSAIQAAVKGLPPGGPPVKVIKQKNAGVAAARNNGIKIAKGEYICCLDADDVIDPLFLSRLAPALDSDPGLGIAYSDFVAFGFDITRGGHWENLLQTEEYDFERLKRGNMLPCCNLFRRVAWERAGGYKDINPSWEDYELWLNMGKLGWPGRRVPGGLFKYRKVVDEGRDFQSHGLEWKLRAKVNSFHRDIYPPAVSVVVPCFRQSQFLPDAIDSALAQTFPDLEVVVVDDGNEPAEAEAIAAIVNRAGPAARLVRLIENSGLATARNTGIDAARGQWILPLDADDRLEPAFLEKALGAIRLNPREFAFCDSVLWWPETGKEQTIEAKEYDFPDLLSKITFPCSILYAKDAWRQAGGYKPQMSQAGGWEDWEFVVTLGEIGICGVRVPEALFRYRQHSNQQMRYDAEAKKPRLQEAMRRLHAATYRGEFPMACCGRQRPAAVQAAPAGPGVVASRANTNGHTNETVLVRYTGASAGSQTWRAPSGRSYRFGGADPLKQVAAADAQWFAGLPMFQVVTA